jgi:hypothetical protein
VPAIDVMAATGAEGKERMALLKELLGDVHDVRVQADANSTLRHAVLLALSGPAGAPRLAGVATRTGGQLPSLVQVAMVHFQAQYLCTSVRNRHAKRR